MGKWRRSWTGYIIEFEKMIVFLDMTYEQFILSLKNDHPPELSEYLESLWYEKKGNWDKAHQIAQELPDKNGSWVHAYLHRVEGDTWNSNYWYSRADRKMPEISLSDEWESLVDYFLNKQAKRLIINK